MSEMLNHQMRLTNFTAFPLIHFIWIVWWAQTKIVLRIEKTTVDAHNFFAVHCETHRQKCLHYAFKMKTIRVFLWISFPFLSGAYFHLHKVFYALSNVYSQIDPVWPHLHSTCLTFSAPEYLTPLFLQLRELPDIETFRNTEQTGNRVSLCLSQFLGNARSGRSLSTVFFFDRSATPNFLIKCLWAFHKLETVGAYKSYFVSFLWRGQVKMKMVRVFHNNWASLYPWMLYLSIPHISTVLQLSAVGPRLSTLCKVSEGPLFEINLTKCNTMWPVAKILECFNVGNYTKLFKIWGFRQFPTTFFWLIVSIWPTFCSANPPSFLNFIRSDSCSPLTLFLLSSNYSQIILEVKNTMNNESTPGLSLATPFMTTDNQDQYKGGKTVLCGARLRRFNQKMHLNSKGWIQRLSSRRARVPSRCLFHFTSPIHISSGFGPQNMLTLYFHLLGFCWNRRSGFKSTPNHKPLT